MKPAPEPQSAITRAVLFVALVGGIIVVAFFMSRAIQLAQDLEGPSVLVIERELNTPSALALDVNRTIAEAPDFAKLLDAAWIGGTATSNDARIIEQARAYLDSLAVEGGAQSFNDPPFESTFNWDERTFRILYLDQA